MYRLFCFYFPLLTILVDVICVPWTRLQVVALDVAFVHAFQVKIKVWKAHLSQMSATPQYRNCADWGQGSVHKDSYNEGLGDNIRPPQVRYKEPSSQTS
ncbi:hypothetical protein BV22DRAFT_1031785 [Leucogyrophana mollusca]|uniref:Uncharacterized protein n=1 Tax=Leucogyrophana mollusca TaxID=85980 RepID=A0ACB8BRJ0_9AGAM|nr:hypothetical protein BV22DRAFT_1031785 [Leucogyrophana mollusca]